VKSIAKILFLKRARDRKSVPIASPFHAVMTRSLKKFRSKTCICWFFVQFIFVGYIPVAESLGISSTTFTQCAAKATEFGEITQNKGHYAVQGHSRSAILVPIESSYTTTY